MNPLKPFGLVCLFTLVAACPPAHALTITATAGGQSTTAAATVGTAQPVLPKLPYTLLHLAPGHPDESNLFTLKVTNSGRVLLATDKSSSGETIGYRWYQGQLSPLIAPTDSWLSLSVGSEDYDQMTVTSMNDAGAVIGDHGTVLTVYLSAFYSVLDQGLYWPVDQTEAQTMPMIADPGPQWYLQQGGLSAGPSYILNDGTIYGWGSSGGMLVGLLGLEEFNDGFVWTSSMAIPSRLGHGSYNDSSFESLYVYAASPQGQLIYFREDYYSGPYDYEVAGKTFHVTLSGVPSGFVPTIINDVGRFVGQLYSDRLTYWGSPTEDLTPLDSGDPRAINTANDILCDEDGEPALWLWQPEQTDTGESPAYHYVKYGLEASPPSHWSLRVGSSLTDQRLLVGQLTRIEDDQGTALPAEQQTTSPVLLVPAELAVDANRDGLITLSAAASPSLADTTSITKPFRFWLNDDDDGGSIGTADIPTSSTPDGQQTTVQGMRDLVDYFPVFLDIKQLLTVLPPGTSNVYKLKQAESGVRFVYTDLSRADAFKYLNDFATGDSLKNADAHWVTDTGYPLDATWLGQVKDADKGVILVEGRNATDKPLILSVEKSDGTVIAEVSLNIKISPVEQMYRHLNLRNGADAPSDGILAGDLSRRNNDSGKATYMGKSDNSGPDNFPDSLTNGSWFIFVVGSNVGGEAARGWESESFKRIYWSHGTDGKFFKGKFLGVSWYGDPHNDSVDFVYDYHMAVRNAFATAGILATRINALSGSKKTIAGHSLGCGLIASAVADAGMTVSSVCFLEAALARESFDGYIASDSLGMTPDAWLDYPPQMWASYWFNGFPSSDARSGLTWRHRFDGAAPVVHNFYSSTEEVLGAYAGTPNQAVVDNIKNALTGGAVGSYAWVVQEKTKGNRWSLLGLVDAGSVYGGWGFNLTDPSDVNDPVFYKDHIASAGLGYTIHDRAVKTASEVGPLTGALLDSIQRAPLFDPGWGATYPPTTSAEGRNYDPSVLRGPSWIQNLYNTNTGSAEAADFTHRSQLLAEAIPALSLPVGANFTTTFGEGGNYNSPDKFADSAHWPSSRGIDISSGLPIWHHSDMRELPYIYIYKLFNQLVTESGQ